MVNKAEVSKSKASVLTILFALLMSLAFLLHSQYLLVWFCFVPLLFAIDEASWLRTYLLSVIGGTLAFSLGTYWIIDFAVISKGYTSLNSFFLAGLYWLYCGHLFAFMLLLFKWLHLRTNIHEFVLFPLVVIGLTSSYPMLFAMRLGESQVEFTSALQAIEFTGVQGLDGIIALTNILIFRLLKHIHNYRQAFTDTSIWIALAVIFTWFAYGYGAGEYWLSKEKEWESLSVGIVQPNEVPRIGKKIHYPGYGYGYPPEMDMTERLTMAGAELVVWPESQHKNYFDSYHIQQAYQNNMKELGTSLIFQDMQTNVDARTGKIINQINTAVMLNQEGRQTGTYEKMKRIPFGEYVPLVSDNKWLKEQVESVFGEFLNELHAGTKHGVLEQGKVNLIPLICYETTYPSFVGSAVNNAVSNYPQNKANILLGLSNDGWFGSTHQPFQHISVSALRAVENRLPLIHAANNGPSIVVAPSGRVLFQSPFQQAGGFLVQVPYSAEQKGSFFSRFPYWVDYTVYALLIVALVMSVKNRQATSKA